MLCPRAQANAQEVEGEADRYARGCPHTVVFAMVDPLAMESFAGKMEDVSSGRRLED